MRSLLLLQTIVLTACTTSHHATPGGDLQMNDLSVMLPLARSQAEFDGGLAASTPARGGVLFPESLYDQDPDVIATEYSTLRVVAFRLDPCFGPLDPASDPSQCDNQLRLVFQPIAFDSTSNVSLAEDSAVHVFYHLTRDELVAAVNELSAARADDAGDADLGPLAPHPVLAREGLTGPLAQRFVQIVTKYAGQANIVRFTSFQLAVLDTNGGVGNPPLVQQFWFLRGFDVTSGQPKPIAIASLPAGTNEVDLGVQTDPVLVTQFSPPTMSQDNLTLLADSNAAMQATPAQRQAAFDSALRIENPRHETPDTIDCASCHMAQPSRELVGHALGLMEAGNANRFAADPSIPAADLLPTTHLIGGDGGLNIHAFSYRGADPMINQRVINETAANLAYLNATLP